MVYHLHLQFSYQSTPSQHTQAIQAFWSQDNVKFIPSMGSLALAVLPAWNPLFLEGLHFLVLSHHSDFSSEVTFTEHSSLTPCLTPRLDLINFILTYTFLSLITFNDHAFYLFDCLPTLLDYKLNVCIICARKMPALILSVCVCERDAFCT